MNIYYDKKFNRPFSIHKKIDGKPLTERLPYLTETKRKKIAEDIAIFYNTLHNIDINKIPEKLKTKFYDEDEKHIGFSFDGSMFGVMYQGTCKAYFVGRNLAG